MLSLPKYGWLPWKRLADSLKSLDRCIYSTASFSEGPHYFLLGGVSLMTRVCWCKRGQIPTSVVNKIELSSSLCLVAAKTNIQHALTIDLPITTEYQRDARVPYVFFLIISGWFGGYHRGMILCGFSLTIIPYYISVDQINQYYLPLVITIC